MPTPSPGHCLQQSVGLARTGWAQASRGHCTFSQCTSPVSPCRDPLCEGCQEGGRVRQPPASSLSFRIPQVTHPRPFIQRPWLGLYLPELNPHCGPARQVLSHLLTGEERGAQEGTGSARGYMELVSWQSQDSHQVSLCPLPAGSQLSKPKGLSLIILILEPLSPRLGFPLLAAPFLALQTHLGCSTGED